MKWCEECQRPVDPVLRPLEMEREGGDGQKRSAIPTAEACPNDPGDWSHFLTSIQPEMVIGTVVCSHPGCGADRGQACDAKAGRHFYEGTEVHRGRWLEFERDVRTGRLSFPPR